jgi:ketosteroid isomerase-like protein
LDKGFAKVRVLSGGVEGWKKAGFRLIHRDPVHHPKDLARLLVSRANSGDIEGMVALYEPSAVLALGNGRVAVGTDAIRQYYTEFLATGVKFNVGDQRSALIGGDIALTSTRLPNGAVTAEIARKQSDGTWLWVIDQPSIVGT